MNPELLAPAGNWDCARAAIANGADAIYFGLPRFNARLRADNFSEEELPEVVSFCHRHGVKAYVALNTLVFTDELADAANYLRLLNRAGVDALIVQDIGLVRLAKLITPELPIHASTQMSITSPEGAEMIHRELGIDRVVLARELSLRELEKFHAEQAALPEKAQADKSLENPLELEVFVHGALCVAYSGQCLTSESLGRRSANRGECAQACRMPYELIVDGALQDLGDKRYLLSPQDLAAVDEIPALLERGVVSFKIEGRLKSPEYVAAVCQVYRKAIDAAQANSEWKPNLAERYPLEMTFSRGLYSGWMHGVNHQELVSARFGKKRGPFVGRVRQVGRDFIEIEQPETPVKPGDGLVFDTGGDTNEEQGGRVFEVKSKRLFFKHDHIDFSRVNPGDRIWKTDDPALNATLKRSYSGKLTPRHKTVLDLCVTGKAGEPLSLNAWSTHSQVQVSSKIALQEARTAPMTDEKLREHLGRFGESVFTLGHLQNDLEGSVILPIGELNRVRRELIYALEQETPRPESDLTVQEILKPLQAPRDHAATSIPRVAPSLSVLCRTSAQIEAALLCGIETLTLDFEDIRRYREAVTRIRAHGATKVFLATPRIQKAGEQGFFKLIENAEPDGVLIRNLGAIEFFRESTLEKIGDFSLNIANPLTAQFFKEKGLQRLTVSYDLNANQALALLENAPPEWFEITLHQHMPMFHMEHCVFAAFMSTGTSFLDCGRPCESHRVHLKDRVGIEHPLRADVGCRNTLFNAVPQTGARYFRNFEAAGLRHYRVELLEENEADTADVLRTYQALLAGQRDGETLWRELKAQSQLGVTGGTLKS
jgi:putative protease